MFSTGWLSLPGSVLRVCRRNTPVRCASSAHRDPAFGEDRAWWQSFGTCRVAQLQRALRSHRRQPRPAIVDLHPARQRMKARRLPQRRPARVVLQKDQAVVALGQRTFPFAERASGSPRAACTVHGVGRPGPPRQRGRRQRICLLQRTVAACARAGHLEVVAGWRLGRCRRGVATPRAPGPLLEQPAQQLRHHRIGLRTLRFARWVCLRRTVLHGRRA